MSDIQRLARHELGSPDGHRSAPRLVLLHGITDSAQCFPGIAARWSSAFRITGVDALGHGESPRFGADQLEQPWDGLVASALDTIRRIADADGTAPVVLGHSMGGGTAARVSVLDPELIRALVLVDPSWRREPLADPVPVEAMRAQLDAEWGDRDAALARGRAALPGWPDDEFEPWVDAKRAVDPAFLATGLPVPGPWDEVAAALTVPTLVVTGDDGVIIDDAVQAELRAIANTAIEVVVVPDAGHSVHRDNPIGFDALVLPWAIAHAG